MPAKNMTTDDKIEAMKKKFKNLDANGDGTLDFDELKDMLMRGNKTFNESECMNLYKGCDTNGDGKISFEEFLNFVYKGDHGKNRSTAGRHQRLAAAAGPSDDGTENDWGPCLKTFTDYAGTDMDGKEFMKFCKDNKLMAKPTKNSAGFQAVDVDMTFAKVVPKGQRRLNFEMFKDACRIIAGKRGISNAAIQDIISGSSGPILQGTQAEAVRFHDDKSTYTGYHAKNEKHAGVDGGASALGRHEKMQEAKAKKMSSSSEDDWGHCERVFRAFAGASGDLDGREFYNMCMNINGLVRGGFMKEEIDSVFSYVCPRGKRSIEFEEFKNAVRYIANDKDEDTNVTQACMAKSNGPEMHGTTKAEYNKFHDDKDLYTGSHVGPGPGGR